MKKIILILAAMLTLASCTKEGDVIYQTDPADAPSTTPLVTEYLSDDVSGGFTVADTTAIHVMYDRQWTGYFKMLVPVCGGAAHTFQHLNDLMGGYDLAGVNVFYDPRNKKDFKASTLPVLTPLEFFNRIDSK